MYPHDRDGTRPAQARDRAGVLTATVAGIFRDTIIAWLHGDPLAWHTACAAAETAHRDALHEHEQDIRSEYAP
jgi:hypothetical protein